MARWLAALILVWPLLEIAGLVWLADWIGLAATLILVVAGFVGGLLVLRHTGLQAIASLRLAVERGEEPGYTLISAVCFTISGLLLIVPGPISDVVALGLMLPQTRRFLLRRTARHFDARASRQATVIEGSYRLVNESDEEDKERKNV